MDAKLGFVEVDGASILVDVDGISVLVCAISGLVVLGTPANLEW